jgi:hypothetical protein
MRQKKSYRSIKGTTLQGELKKFKNIVSKKLGKIDWKRVGVVALALLLFVANAGVLGLEAQLIAQGITKFMMA